jgi:cyclopropane fatty-acyl-phospholipid synthase-like methyltransferase
LQSAYIANQEANGVGMDVYEAVVKQATKNIDMWGLSDRFDILRGDIRHPSNQITDPFDLITLYNNIYYFNNQDRTKLINNLSRITTLDAICKHLKCQPGDILEYEGENESLSI